MRLSACALFRCVSVPPTIPSVLYARLVPSGSPYIESWWDWTRMHALVVMHTVMQRTLCENVDSAKIKVPFYMTDIDILRVASMHRIVIHCIDISMNRYIPIAYHKMREGMSVAHNVLKVLINLLPFSFATLHESDGVRLPHALSHTPGKNRPW